MLIKRFIFIPSHPYSSGPHKTEDAVKDTGIAYPDTHPCWIMGNHTGKETHGTTGTRGQRQSTQTMLLFQNAMGKISQTELPHVFHFSVHTATLIQVKINVFALKTNTQKSSLKLLLFCAADNDSISFVLVTLLHYKRITMQKMRTSGDYCVNQFIYSWNSRFCWL